jgi:lipopolysaccharide biosynthesis glycosyltransferase
MTIAYASDSNYAALTAISAVSLLKNNPGAEIILLGCNLDEESVVTVKTRVEKFGGSFRLVDVSEKINSLRSMGVNSYVSYAVYARIFIADLLPDLRENILYLDCDTLVVDSVKEIFETDLEGKPLALAPDAIHPAYKRVISLPPEKPYFNTGVALINLGKWRELECAERIMRELESPHGRNPLGDQDVIVRVLNSEIAELDRRWNFLSQHVLYGRKEKPAIWHFSGNTLGRPWLTSSRHPMRKKYREIAAEAGLEKAAEQTKPMPAEYKIQYFLYKALPGFLFRPICNLMLRTHIKLTYGI